MAASTAGAERPATRSSRGDLISPLLPYSSVEKDMRSLYEEYMKNRTTYLFNKGMAIDVRGSIDRRQSLGGGVCERGELPGYSALTPLTSLQRFRSKGSTFP